VSAARLPRVAGGVVLALALGALAGWQFQLPWLRGPAHGAMNPVTAVGLLLLGVALLAFAAPPGAAAHRLEQGCAAAAAALGVLRLAGEVAHIAPALDRLLFPLRVAAETPPNRVAPQTAACFALLGTALVLGRRRGRGAWAAHFCAVATVFIALVGVTAHAYGSRLLYGGMALNTAAAFLVAGVAVLWALPEQGVAGLFTGATPGAVLARRLLPAIVATPLVLGWLRLAGERAGWYDTAAGTAVFAASVVAVLAGAAWWSARSLDRADARRRAAEQALQESEHRLFQILEAMPVAVFVLDGAGRPYYANQRSRELLGRGIVPEATPDRLPEVYRAVVAGSDDLYPAHRQPIVRALAGEAAYVADMEICRPDRRVPIEVWAAPVRDAAGRVAFAVAAFNDIAERLRIEGALRESEERFRTLAATANDAIVSADSSGAVTYFNPAAERIFGHRASDVAGQPLTALMPERFRDAHRAGLARYLATGEPRVVGRTVELAGLRRDGSEFPLELSLAAWRRGSAVAFTAIIRDITARKAAEDALRRYAAQLETANAELDAFAYSVSHDLRAPLRAIDGFSQALLEDYAARLDAAGREHLERVRQATRRMGQLIDDLLNLSRVTRAQMQLGPVDLSALARRIAADLRRLEPARDVEFVVAPDLVVRGDPGLLQVALENLLGNAWKFTAPRPRARIEVGVTQRDGRAVYFVRDDGVGFDMRYADKLFGAFQRLHGTAEFAGTGIGLATVQRIIHRHGGRVWAEGAVGRGATFYFTL
jgi:PAS domain S-box-containing protein